MQPGSQKEGIPHKYRGYVLGDPWMTPGAMVGWSIFLGEGTTAALNKLHGLAWSVLKLANETEDAITSIDQEMRALRKVAIQNRMGLDILLAEKGGLCKVLGVSCCFRIPDAHENLSCIVQHLQNAIRVSPPADDSLAAWFEGWGNG
ncbi:hypothetical protein AAFF_G00198090 [Aldrovandia affinis]|uniref:ERVV2 protein n=1 Tax=Aldrovandia affinis TaxID=143900 RepID=A0AAD7W5T3_9TELE|nr:hypothetical protein AAFF_G00198090 [Aldrovandia affinis]